MDSAPLVNVEVYLFERGSLNPVSCSFPNRVTLRWARNEVTKAGVRLGPAHDTPDRVGSAVGQRETRVVDGNNFPVWIFNDVRVDAAKMYFMAHVENVDVRTNIWSHASDPRTVLAYQWTPIAISETAPSAVDAFIQIAWPHDVQGNPAPVSEAEFLNIGVDLAPHLDRAERSPFGWPSLGFSFNRPVVLLQSLNDGFLKPAMTADESVMMTGPASSGATSWPRRVFNNVDVSSAKDPTNKYYFAVDVNDVSTHTTIWVHGADGRTYFPQKDVPTRSCQD